MTTQTETQTPALNLAIIDAATSTQLIRLELVDDNPWQPRGELTDIEELAEDIGREGLHQLPQVRPMPDGRYQTAFGHRRIAALRHLGVLEFGLRVRPATDLQMATWALAENTRRRDLKPMEEYRAWAKALEIEGMTQPALAAAMGLDRSTVANNLRLLRLPALVLDHVDSGEMSAHAAREFLCLQGADGHFHEDVAKQVMSIVTTGVPDWRVARIRYQINEAVVGRSVSEWRRLFGESGFIGGGHGTPPTFDIEAFKQEHAAKVHTLPADKWTGPQPWQQGPEHGKVEKEASRDWTCATGPWVKAQKLGQAAAEGVAGAAAKRTTTDSTPKTPGKTSKWPQTLSQDAVFKAVSPEKDGPLVKTLSKDERDANAAAQMGTRGNPGKFVKGGKEFQAIVDERLENDYGFYDYKLRKVPGYFADIIECRTKCTTGAQYRQQDDKSPLLLTCTNESCFDQHCTKGRAVIETKVSKAVREVDARDAELYAVLEERLTVEPVEAAQLMAGLMLLGIRMQKVEPDTNDYEVRRELAVWSANAVAIATAAGLKTPDDFADGKQFDISAANATELMRRAIVQRTRNKEMQLFVEQLVKATTTPALPAEDGLTQE